MKQLEKRRAKSVLAVLTLSALLLAATIWLGFRQIAVPTLKPLADPIRGRQGFIDDLRPAIMRPAMCDDDRPCS